MIDIDVVIGGKYLNWDRPVYVTVPDDEEENALHGMIAQMLGWS